MQPQRPTSVTVIAILQFVFGGLSLCGGVIGLSSALGNTGTGPNAELEQAIPGYTTIQTVQVAVSLLLAVVMLASGLGLLQMQPWGRMLALVWAVAYMVVQVAGLIFTVAFVMPALDNVLAKMAAGNPNAATVLAVARGSMVFGLVISGLFLIYPILVLVVLSRPNVKRAFAGLPPDDLGPRDEGWREGPAQPGDGYDRREDDLDPGYRRGDPGIRE